VEVTLSSQTVTDPWVCPCCGSGQTALGWHEDYGFPEIVLDNDHLPDDEIRECLDCGCAFWEVGPADLLRVIAKGRVG